MTVEPIFEIIPDFEPPQDYSAEDQYRDFRRVFMDSDEGKRVLHQIIAWTGFFKVLRPSDLRPEVLAHCNGERHVGMKILQAVTKEPPTRPSEAKRKRSA